MATTTPPRRPATPAARAAAAPDSSRKQIAVGVLVVVVGLVVGLTLWLGRGGTTAESEPVGGGIMGHVHGLGIDPADGTLYAGTHLGVHRVADDGTTEQVGPARDYMGFTVVGPGHFLASGHPALDEEAPPNLGLIESTDGGETWETLSLGGEADFHSLDARGDVVYGHWIDRLMATTDKKTWETRGQWPIADFAISPDDAETLVATTASGLVRSTDGGRSFSYVGGDAPLLQLVTWPAADRLVGVAPDGAVHASADGGTTWEQRGSVDEQPHAIAVAGETVHVAVEQRILRSTDGGRTFTTLYDES